MHTVMFGGGQLPPEQPLADTGVCAQAVVDVVFKRFLFTGSWNKKAKMWDPQTGAYLPVMVGWHIRFWEMMAIV